MNKYKVVITSKALEDLKNCVSFVMNVSREAAQKLQNDLFDSFRSLESFPEKHPIFEMIKSFPLIVRKKVVNQRYVVLFSIKENEILIFRILDVRRKFEGLL